MIYYKHNSIPLEEINLGINERGFDIFGNYIQIDMFGEPSIIKKTILNDEERVDEYKNEIFLKGFWAQTNKLIAGYEIQNEIEE